MNAMSTQESAALTNALFSSTEERAIALLGQSLPLETVASAVGLSVSRISQISTDPKCAARISQLRYEALQKHNRRDEGYDSIEDDLMDKLRGSVPLLIRPMEILKAIQVINSAKRRGTTGDQLAPQQISPVVQLTIPTQVIQSFTTNIHNQVISAGSQELITIPSGNMQKLLESKAKNDSTPKLPSPSNPNTSSNSGTNSSGKETDSGSGA